MTKPKVLIVDDEVDFLEALAERLSSRGIEVHTANDGITAVKLASKEKFHAIFLDFAMPGLNGIETLKLILSQNPNALIYLLTGKASLKDGVEAIKLGAKDVLEKPIELNQLLDVIERAETEFTIQLEQQIKESISSILRTKGW
ncbi:MAG: response regulator [Candidatus Kapaibacteriota bacterium]|jgi:DNA-binding NtrC family response regulator